MKLDRNKIYNLSELTSDEHTELTNYLQNNYGNWKNFVKIYNGYVLHFDKEHNTWYQGIKEPTANAKELFYTLENVQVDCRELSEDQIKKMADVFESNGYKVWDDMRALDIEYGDFLMVGLDNEVYLNNGFKSKHTITYEKFMELFSNKEENFKKLVEVLNEELTEKAYEVSYIAEKPKQYQIGIDTFERCEANMTKEEILACVRFNIDKYNWRNKGQDLEDLEKIISYANWAIKQLKQQDYETKV